MSYKYKKQKRVFITILIAGLFLSGCKEIDNDNKDVTNNLSEEKELEYSENESIEDESTNVENIDMEARIWEMVQELEGDNKEETEQTEQGYNIPIEETIQKEAKEDCINKMELIKEIYTKAFHQTITNNETIEEDLNIELSKEIFLQMYEILKKTEDTITISESPFDIANFEKLDSFLVNAQNGIEGQVVVYEINIEGGITRSEFIFDGMDLYVLATNGIWNEKIEPVLTYTTYNKVKMWEYTKKGWFIFEYVTPEVPELSERIDGNALLRVKPLKEEYKQIYEMYLQPIGYQGNNLFCSNWDKEHMEELDYNALFQYLYVVEYGKRFDNNLYIDGIPKTEFENIITKYLLITKSQLRQYAIYDTQTQTYKWEPLNCWNHTLNEFDAAISEIIDMKENKDGTVTLIIDAVCERMGLDRVVSHELTVKFLEDGGICYLGNKMLGNELDVMPQYKYRCKE